MKKIKVNADLYIGEDKLATVKEVNDSIDTSINDYMTEHPQKEYTAGNNIEISDDGVISSNIDTNTINDVVSDYLTNNPPQAYDDTEIREQIQNVSDKLVDDGDGSKFLSNDGTYKEVAGNEDFNGILARENTSIALLTTNGFTDTAGVIKPGSFFKRSDYIPVIKDDTIDYNLFCNTDSNVISFYDKDKTYVSGIVSSKKTQIGRTTVPSDGYMIVSCNDSRLSVSYIHINRKDFDVVNDLSIKEKLISYDIHNETPNNGGITTTGATNTDGNMYWFQSVRVVPGVILEYNACTPSTGQCCIALFDVNGALISTHVTDNIMKHGFITMPENIASVMLSCKRGDYTNGKAYFKFLTFGNLTKTDKDKIDSLYYELVEPESTEVGLLTYNGNVTSSTTSIETGLFVLNRGETLHAVIKTNGADGTGNASAFEYYSDGTRLRSISNSADGLTYTALKDKEYIKISYTKFQSHYFYKTFDETAAITELLGKQEEYDLSLLRYRYKTALCIGDSLTYGGQTGTSTSCITNYPDYLSRMTGMKVTNAGVSGINTKGWVEREMPKYDFTKYDCVFICLGTNSGVTGDNLTAYNSLVSTIKTDSPDTAIILINAKWFTDDTNTNIENIAKDNDLLYINAFWGRIYSLRGIQDNPTYFCDIPGDTTHLSPTGYLFMAKIILDEFCKDIAAHPNRYNQRKLTPYEDDSLNLDKELSRSYTDAVAISLKKDSGLSTATIDVVDTTHTKVTFPSDNTNHYCYQSMIDSVTNLKGKHVLVTIKNNGSQEMPVPNRLLLSLGKNWGDKLQACDEINSLNIPSGSTKVYDFDIDSLSIADNTRDVYLIVGSEKQSFDFTFTVSCDVVTYNSKEYFVKYSYQADTATEAVHAATATKLESNSKIVACFGDSLTHGAPVYGDKSYPGKLQALLGNEYQVVNQGIGGETAQGILARQGAYPAVVSPFTIPADTTAVDVTLKTHIGTNIMWAQSNMATKVNPVTINGIEGTLTQSTNADSSSYSYTFTRNVDGTEVVVDRPALLKTNPSKIYADAIQILWIGQNGTWANEDELVSIHRAAIRHLKTDRYIIIGLTSDTATVRATLEKKMQAEFGERYINMRTYLVEYGLVDAGLSATSNDEAQIAQGLVPESLRADSVHFTELGYASIAKAVYARGQYLGYWE